MTEHPAATAQEKSPLIALGRSAPDAEIVERDKGKFGSLVTGILRDRLAEVTEESAALAGIAEKSGLEQEGAALNTELHDRLSKQLLENPDGRMSLFQFTVPFGSRVISPPYDEEWDLGFGTAWEATLDGAFAMLAGDGFSAAGVGLYLTTNQPAEVAITPMGTYDYGFTAFQHAPAFRSRGGLGLLAYVDGDPQPAARREATLWDLSGLSFLTSSRGNGQIAEAHSPPSGLGPVYLAPLIMGLNPGHRYLVWLWCWQTTHQNQGVLGAMRVNMPFLKVEAGPPVVIH